MTEPGATWTTTVNILNQYLSDLDAYVQALSSRADQQIKDLTETRQDLVDADASRVRILELLKTLQAPDYFDEEDN